MDDGAGVGEVDVVGLAAQQQPEDVKPHTEGGPPAPVREPVREPVTPPNPPEPGGERAAPKEDRKKIEERFWRTFANWPHFATVSKEKGLRVWFKLA